MTVAILNEDSQQRVLLSYQRNYGALVLAYNDLRKRGDFSAMDGLKVKANALWLEIENYINPDKKFFSEESAEFASGIVKQIHEFIRVYLPDGEVDDNVVSSFQIKYNKYIANFAA